MIAPLRESDPETTQTCRRLREAHRFVASTLLRRDCAADGGSPVAAWKAWSLALWALVVTAVYAAAMLGWL